MLGNDEKYEKEKGQLHTLQGRYIDAINKIFEKKEQECSKRLKTCNSEIQSQVEMLRSKMNTLEERVKTHEDAQTVYSNHDVIETDRELKNLVTENEQYEFDPNVHELQTMNYPGIFDVQTEDIAAKIESFVFARQEGKLPILKTYLLVV